MMENLKVLFEKAKIKYIVSVDDCYNPNIVLDKLDISGYFIENIDIAITFCNEVGLTSFEETITSLEGDNVDYIESFVNTLSDDEVEIFQNKYFVSSDAEKKSLERFCQNLKDNGIIIDYEKVSSIQDSEKLYNDLEEHFDIGEENRVLWLIDNDFQKTNGSSQDGTKLISKFISLNKPNNVYALASAQLSADTDNDAFRTSLDNDDYSQTLLACIIHKHKIIEEAYDELYEQMYSGFRENYSGIIIENLKNNLSSAATIAGETIKSIRDEAIHKVFLLGSKSEGVSPLETFQRLMMVILKTDISKQLSDKYDIISKLIYDYSELCSWCETKSDEKGDFEKIEKIRRDECYDENINGMYSPVSYGDIFLINNQHYLLVSQSCNVVIRSNGQRKSQCATLVQIECSDKSDESHYLLEYFNPRKKHCVSYNNTINIDFLVLDLCCLNANGELSLYSDFNFEEVRYRYTDGMSVALLNTIMHNTNLINAYKEIESQKDSLKIDEIISKVREIYKDNTTELSANFNNGINYNGKRIFRLNQNITDDISKKYFEYHSRMGLDFDFARQYKVYEFDLIYNFDFSILGLLEANINLKKKYRYYHSEELSNSELKKKINDDFSNYYRKEILQTTNNSVKIPKVNLTNMTIQLEPLHIPIKINGKIHYDIITVNNDILTLKIPKEYFVDNLLSKSNNEYKNEDESTKIKVSNVSISFDFINGQPLIVDNKDILVEPYEFTFAVDNGIILSFCSMEVCEI